MAYTSSQFQCPEQKKKILPPHLRHFDTTIWMIFAAGWVKGDVYRPYPTIFAQEQAVDAGLLEPCSEDYTYRLTDTALGYLHKVYGR